MSKLKQYKTKKSKSVAREPNADYNKKHGDVTEADFTKVVKRILKAKPPKDK